MNWETRLLLNKKYLIALLLIFFTLQSYGQSENVYTYSITEGLPQSQVFAICQDSFGYLWAGTQGGGVAKFDGQKFDVFTEQHGLPSNYVNALLVDHSNTLWLGTTKGLFALSFDGSPDQGSSILADKEILCLAEMNQIIYAGTREGLFQLNRKLKRWQEVNLSTPNSRIQVNDLKVISGRLWIATEKGLWIKQNGKSTLLKVKGLPYPNINNVLFDENHSVWLSVLGYGLLSLDELSLKIRQTLTLPLLTKTRCLLIESADHLWIGTENDGVCSYNVHTGSLTQLTEDAGLSTSKIRALLKDKWGNLWMGTSGAGLLRKSNQLFKSYNLFDFEFGSNRVYSVANGPSNSIYFAVSKDNIGYYKNNVFRVIDIDSLNINVKIKSIATDTLSRLWIGTEGKGLYCIDSTFALHFNQAGQLLSDDYITHLVVDEKNQIWVATQSSGISVFNLVGTTLVKILQVDSRQGLSEKHITCLARDTFSKKTWFVGRNGSSGFITDLGKLTLFDATSGLPYKTIKTLALNKAGRCCLAVEGQGVYCMDASNISVPSFIKLAAPDKTYSSNIYSMLFDANQNLWLGSENGVYKLILDSVSMSLKNVTWFGRDDGFGGIESCHNSICTDKNNNIWFGTMNGLVQYNPEFKTGIQLPPILFIKDVLLFNKTTHQTAFASCFQPLAIQLSKELPHNQNHLSFTFDAVHLNHPNKLQFRFKLEGSSDKWSEWSNEKRINFSGIPPGHYCFVVQATFDRVHLSSTKQLCFNIATPYWQKTWFRLLLAAIGLFAILSVFYYREKTIKQKAEAKNKELKIQNELLSLEQKSLQLQMNPHFIFNALNSIQSLVVTAQPDEARLQIQNFAVLMRSILNNARKTEVSLNEEIDLLKKYLTMEQFCQQNNFTFHFTLDPDIDADEIYLPSMLIQPYIENAVIHGISHLQSPGKIDISFQMKNAQLVCTIEDNGVGRKKAAELSINRKEGHVSVGMQVTAQRLNTLRTDSNSLPVTVIDLYDEAGHASGTKVVLLIPVKTHF